MVSALINFHCKRNFDIDWQVVLFEIFLCHCKETFFYMFTYNIFCPLYGVCPFNIAVKLIFFVNSSG